MSATKRRLAGLLGWAGLAAPILLLVLISVFPFPFVRVAGCAGALRGVEVVGREVVTGARVSADGTFGARFEVGKVTVLDAASGKTLRGPWLHPHSEWVGLLGENYCVAGAGLECASLATGTPVVTRRSLEAQHPALVNHWLADGRDYRLHPAGRVVFKTDDGRYWALSKDLRLTETLEKDSRTSGPAGATTDDAGGPAVRWTGEGPRRLQVLPAGALSAKSWLEPAFIVDRRTGQALQTRGGWLMASLASRDPRRHAHGYTVSSVDATGTEAWKTVLGDAVFVVAADSVEGRVLLRLGGDSAEGVQALDPATGATVWVRRFGAWPW